MTNKKETPGLLLRMHPLQRLGISFTTAILSLLFLTNTSYDILFKSVVSWCVFSITFLIMSWIIFFKRPLSEIRKYAKAEDGSRVFVIISTILAAFASMVTVSVMIIGAGDKIKEQVLLVPVCLLSVLVSWFLVHTILTFHYAHLYYDDEGDKGDRGGLDFPGKESPDYLDFAYFSFVIGMTFQVSDVEISHKRMRRLALFHGLIAFALNTFVVALTINFVAGLSK